ncbi:hypothetical protein ACJMK2_010370 [Sinanodonta woodiana]|uniref:G-protein coupled receptors family 1 profile domain-containing protein n=1 Tax=Sinanodonta woodiana TaxID=1069815 RepID=A0ABD3VF52_SINWO
MPSITNKIDYMANGETSIRLEMDPVHTNHTHVTNTYPYISWNNSQIYNYYLPSEEISSENQMHIALVFHTYFTPIFIIIGAVGNTLTIFTLHRKNMCNWSICYYVTVYAVGNIFVLFLATGLAWVSSVANIKYVSDISDWGCKLWQFILRVMTYSGIWLVVAMMIDQYIYLWHPFKVGVMCNVFMAKFATVMIFVGLIVVSVHSMWTFELLPNGCYILHTPNDLHALIWPWVAVSFYSFIPILILIALIMLNICGLFLKNPRKRSSAQLQLPVDFTLSVLILATLFVLFVTPATVIHIIEFTLPVSWLNHADFMQKFQTAKIVCAFLVSLNPVIGFYILVSVSSKFRSELHGFTSSCWQEGSCFRRFTQIYEMQVNSNGSSTQLEYEHYSETTPL